jgi:hypothetical protein
MPSNSLTPAFRYPKMNRTSLGGLPVAKNWTEQDERELQEFLTALSPEEVKLHLRFAERFRRKREADPSLTFEEFLHRTEWLLDHPMPLPPPKGPMILLE